MRHHQKPPGCYGGPITFGKRRVGNLVYNPERGNTVLKLSNIIEDQDGNGYLAVKDNGKPARSFPDHPDTDKKIVFRVRWPWSKKQRRKKP